MQNRRQTPRFDETKIKLALDVMDQLEKPFVLMLVSAEGQIWMNFLKDKNEILTQYFQFMDIEGSNILFALIS